MNSEADAITKCPACEYLLEQITVAGLRLDRCPHCNGYWLDDGELTALARSMGQLTITPEQDARVIFRKVSPGHKNPQRRCPRCGVLLRNFKLL